MKLVSNWNFYATFEGIYDGLEAEVLQFVVVLNTISFLTPVKTLKNETSYAFGST